MVIRYFKCLSDAFFEIEAKHQPGAAQKIEIDDLHGRCLRIIESSDRGHAFDSFVNEDVIKTMTEIEARGAKGLNNWLIVFDWNTGSFVNWEIIGRSPTEAIQSYVRMEKQYPAESGYEVVMIGSSEVATVRQTHSHYFGIDTYNAILEGLDASLLGFRKKIDLDVGARQILYKLHNGRYWGGKALSRDTLKNHHCQNVFTFASSLDALIQKQLVLKAKGISLNPKFKAEIESYL